MASFRLVLALCAVLCAHTVWAGPLVPAESGTATLDPYRLPRNVLPTQYTLRLTPNLDPEFTGAVRTFEGTVRIDVRVEEETDTIVLHASGINVEGEDTSVHKVPEEGEPSPGENLVSHHTFDTEHEFLNLLLTEELRAGENYTISIKFKGTLRDDMYGFYISTYKDQENEIKMLVATQFQPTHARKAFPCFDEPSFKARFQVTIVAPTHMQVLGNMPASETTLRDDGNKEVTLENSMIMSSYLLAFVVSPFEGAPEPDWSGEGIKFTTWARPDALNWTEYSLRVSRPMLETLEEYTGIPYSISDNYKVDQVALPDFAAGAMENWGLITYRETALLFNDGSADARKRVATVIAHELLHMWFGNLITTFWWDTTWLNEGFARFFQYFVTDKVEDTWSMWDQFLVDQHQMVFALDALATSEALTHSVSTPSQVSASFGSITYNKGASILRMISSTIGPDKFQSALRNYLEENKFSTVTPEKLFKHLKVHAEIANLTPEEFERFLLSWTEKPGFPVVTVTRNYETNTCSVSQRRFLLKGEGSEQYYVPITWTKQGESFEVTTPKSFLIPEQALEIDGMPNKDQWVIFNVQETGFYRVNYDQENWELLADSLQKSAIEDIHKLNRAQLLDDAFNLARAGLLAYDTAFRLADYLPREKEYVPWASALTAFSYLDRMLVNHPKYPVFKRYILRLIDRTYLRFLSARWMTLEGIPEGHVDKLFVNRIAERACSLDHEICIGQSVLDLRRYLSDNTLIPADLRSVIYCHGIRHLSDFEWSLMWSLYQESNDDVERGLLVDGLSCSYNESRLTELLQHTIDGQYIRKQDASSVFTSVYSNKMGTEVALNFLDQNFDQVANYYGSMGAINNIVTGIAGRLTTAQQHRKLEEFVTKHAEKLGPTGNAALEIVEDNIRWLAANQQTIISILEEKELKRYRLPQDVMPVYYLLRLEPSLQTKSFLGEEIIRVVANVPTDTIVLHAAGVWLTAHNVYSFWGNDVFETHSYDDQLQHLTIYLKEPMTPGFPYEIYLRFYGNLRDDMYGFYMSSYIDEHGNERRIAATQFQPTHARRAFPCFDEPSFKASFTVYIQAPPDYQVLSNMPVQHIRVWDDNRTETVFLTTPTMSTYLLAFVVSDFVSMDDLGGNVEFKTWVRSNARPWANYSIQVSRNILEALEEYTNVPYTDPSLDFPLAKVDQVALPDFSAGAMENWGLVTYRETALLYNDGTASARKSVATIIAHELAHMWFGNLVTTDWWDTTWLNEGFAQYFQFFITDKVKPTWRLMDQFLVDHHQAVFASDSLVTSAALTADAYTPAQVSARFGGITYSKGASVLRMISAIVGAVNFQEVLQTYLKANAYETTKPNDLFDQFVKKSSAANLNEIHFRGLLRSWTEQAGFPVLNIQRDYQGGNAIITQNRFFLKEPTESDSKLYYIPLTWVTEGGNFTLRTPQAYITNEERSVTVQIAADANKWIIFNTQETGFYRVNYDDRNWKMIVNYLTDQTKPLNGIHVLNRAQLLDDAFNLARAGQLPYETAISVSDYLPREKDYIPWTSALTAFSYLQRMLIRHENYATLKNYILLLLEDLYMQYKFEDHEEHIDKLLLNRVSSWACSLGNEHCVSSAVRALTEYIDQDLMVPADLRSIAYCYGIRHSANRYWDELWEKYKISKDNSEKTILMAGLACSHDTSKLEELLLHSISGEHIRKQDASSVFTYVYGNSVGVEVALDFLDNYFTQVQEYYGSMGAINNIVIGISGRLTTSEQRNKMENFVTRYNDDLGVTASSALEIIDENLDWLEEQAEEILHVIQIHTTTTTRITTTATTPLFTTSTTARPPSSTNTPSVGTQPASPTTPSAGTQPASPTTPTAGTQPSSPTTPSAGTQPASPTTPTAGTQPSSPTTPSDGTQPSSPTTPSAGTQPASPTTPLATEEPTTPGYGHRTRSSSQMALITVVTVCYILIFT